MTACRMNKKSENDLDNFIESYEVPTKEEQRATIFDLFRFPSIRRNQLILNACWLSFSMGYFGLAYNTPSFNWSPFLVFSFPGMLGFVVGYIDPFLENYFGRKPMLTIPLFTTGLLLFSTMAFPTGSTGITVCAIVGNVFAGVAFGVGYAITKEVMPTVARSTALGTASASARIGSMLSPIIAMLDVYMEASYGTKALRYQKQKCVFLGFTTISLRNNTVYHGYHEHMDLAGNKEHQTARDTRRS
jgi:hypothetical protein